MKEPEGAVIAGLDEFMLRTGHLVVLCEAALENDGNLRRLTVESGERLTRSIPVTSEIGPAVAAYLIQKGLCHVRGAAQSREPKYSHLGGFVDADGIPKLTSVGSAPIEIEWQDAMLADPSVPSRVGAITITAKSGSKTGFSHILDWAQLLELVDNNGQATPLGRLLARRYQSNAGLNPYAPSAYKLPIAYQLFLKDGDLLFHLFKQLSQHQETLKKSAAQRLFVVALKAVGDELERAGTSSSGSYQVFQQLRDLEKSASRNDVPIEELSTAWHRASSRFETLVDLRLLEKPGKDGPYQYAYASTDAPGRALRAIEQSSTLLDWVELHLVDLLFPEATPMELTIESLADELDQIAAVLAFPSVLLPIECLAVGIASARASVNESISIRHLRESIEQLPRHLPDRARLARGSFGQRAEFLSWRTNRS